MRTTIDAAGRIVIPKKIREEAGLEPGMELDIEVEEGKIEIEPASKVRLEWQDGFLVAVCDEELPPMTVEEVEAIRQQIYLDREQQIVSPSCDDLPS